MTAPLDNFTRQYVEWAGRVQAAPPIFHEIAALMACAAALGDRVWIRPGFKARIYPSFWACFVGPSDTHKTAAINLALSLLGEACPGIELPSDFSKEAAFDTIAERGHGIICWPEIGVPFEAMTQKHNQGVVSLLTHIWDARFYDSRKTKTHGLIEMRFPAVGIIGGGKERWFSEQLDSQRLIKTGFIGRWLFFQETRGTGYKPFFGEDGSGPDEHIRTLLVDHLRGLAECGEVVMHPGAGGLALEEFGASLQHDDTQDPAEFQGRAEENVCKLAMAIQAAKGPHYLAELRPEAVEDAIRLWRRSYADGRALVERASGHSRDADELDRVFAIIKSEGIIARTELYRRSKMKKRTLDDILLSLDEGGRIVAVDEGIPEGGGPRKTTYRAAKN